MLGCPGILMSLYEPTFHATPSLVQRNRFTSAQLFLVFRSEYTMCTCSCTVGKNQVSFSMTLGNEEPKHLRMRTARMKQDRESNYYYYY